MSVIQPPSRRYQSTNRSGNLEITIPSTKRWFMIAFLAFWLIGWAFGEITAGIMLVGGLITLLTQNGTDLSAFSFVGLFMLVWFTLWTIGGITAIYTLFWSLAGKEVIQVNLQGITIRKQIFGMGRSKEYLADYIKDLRISPPPHNRYRRRGFVFASGIIGFDYGAKTFRFGNGVDEAEAKLILAEIKRHSPQYG